MRDFARYVILSPVMAAPALAGTIPLNQGSYPFSGTGTLDDKGAPGSDGIASRARVAPLGTAIRRSHVGP